MQNSVHQSGRHFLQVPGPTPIPERILAAMNRQMLDHRGPQFQDLALEVLSGIRTIFRTKSPVILFPSSGTGALEAALVNTLSPGDCVLFAGTGEFDLLWATTARNLALRPIVIKTDWRSGANADQVEDHLRADIGHDIKAVCVVHNETSTGARTWIEEIRAALDATSHPALLLVDAVSSLAAMDYRHDDWRVDVSVAGSQKGLMLPPGLAFNAVSERALAASRVATSPRSYWSWKAMLEQNADGFFPFTPAISLLYGLAESLKMLHEFGLENVFARHERHAAAVRRAAGTWGLELWCRDQRCYSPAVTAITMPKGHDADVFRNVVLERFNVSLARGLNRLAGKIFRIGHLGYINDSTIVAALAAVEMGLKLAKVPHASGGVDAALACLLDDDSTSLLSRGRQSKTRMDHQVEIPCAAVLPRLASAQKFSSGSG